MPAPPPVGSSSSSSGHDVTEKRLKLGHSQATLATRTLLLVCCGCCLMPAEQHHGEEACFFPRGGRRGSGPCWLGADRGKWPRFVQLTGSTCFAGDFFQQRALAAAGCCWAKGSHHHCSASSQQTPTKPASPSAPKTFLLISLQTKSGLRCNEFVQSSKSSFENLIFPVFRFQSRTK